MDTDRWYLYEMSVCLSENRRTVIRRTQIKKRYLCVNFIILNYNILIKKINILIIMRIFYFVDEILYE